MSAALHAELAQSMVAQQASRQPLPRQLTASETDALRASLGEVKGGLDAPGMAHILVLMRASNDLTHEGIQTALSHALDLPLSGAQRATAVGLLAQAEYPLSPEARAQARALLQNIDRETSTTLTTALDSADQHLPLDRTAREAVRVLRDRVRMAPPVPGKDIPDETPANAPALAASVATRKDADQESAARVVPAIPKRQGVRFGTTSNRDIHDKENNATNRSVSDLIKQLNNWQPAQGKVVIRTPDGNRSYLRSTQGSWMLKTSLEQVARPDSGPAHYLRITAMQNNWARKELLPVSQMERRRGLTTHIDTSSLNHSGLAR